MGIDHRASRVMEMIPAVTAVVGRLVAVGTLTNAVRQYRRKVHLEIFRVYAYRYNAIVTPNIYQKWERALQGDREQWPDVAPTMLQYLNLCGRNFI